MKKIVLLLLVVLLITPLVSGADWDNVLNYENEDLTIKITNWLGLFGWLGLDDEIGTAELKSHSSVDEIRKVGAGNQVVMWYDFNFVNLYLNGLGEVEFTDMGTGEKIDRAYSFVYWGEKERDIYGQGKCSFSINGTKTCESIIVGKETYNDWLLYNSKDIPKGDLRIGLKTYVEIDDKVDGVWTIAGKKVKKHAVWTAELNVGLSSYYKLDEASGVVLDSLDNYNMTNTNAEYSVGGIINTAYNFTDNDYLTRTQNLPLSGSINFWIYPIFAQNDGLVHTIISNANAADNFGRISIIKQSDNQYTFFLGNDAGTDQSAFTFDDSIFPENNWGMLTFVYTTNDIRVYANGVSLDNDTSATMSTSPPTDDLRIGQWINQDIPWEGRIDEIGIWNRTLTHAEVTQLYNGGTGISYLPLLFPLLTLNAPVNTFNTTNQTIDFNGTVKAFVEELANVSLILNNSYNGTNSSGINNTEYIFTRTLADGFYNWTMEVCDVVDLCQNETVRTFEIRRFLEHLFTFNASSFETDTETFFVNITTDGLTPTNAKLIYNGTSNPATITNTAGNDYNISATIDIPETAETKPFFFNFTTSGTEYSTTTQTQIINLTNFTFCLGGITYMNITFKNETIAEELVTAQIDADWTYWLGGGDTFKTLTHTNASENLNYTFCLEGGAQNRTLNTNISTTYDNSISEQRNFASDFILNNDTTNLTLFLLPTVDGVFITFQVVTVAEQVISGVDINVTKNSVIVETGTTDAAGLRAFFLDPDTTYGFSFFKSGFDIFTTSLAPTQTTFTVTLGSVAGDVINDTTKGISYFINPVANVLDNNTDIEFNLTFVSSFWALDNFELFLKNSTGNFFNSTSSTTASGGFLTQTLNTANNTDLIMEITWTINGNQTNVTRTWIVRNFEDEGFSIRTFFDDLSTYLTSNMFGLTSFGLGIIIFLIITLVTGVLSVKFGITSPPGIAIIVFTLVAFFDVALGIMPNPVNAVPNFPTIFMGVVFLGTFIKEAIVR